MKQKCTHCDGLGHFYNHSTFQSEHCPHCEGKGYIETVETPVVVEAPIVEAPKPAVRKTTTKTVVETPVEAPVEPTIEPQADVDASKN